jgi:hypothetical protein
VKKNTSFTLTTEEADALQRQAEAQGVSKSALVGRLIMKEEERQGLAQRVKALEAFCERVLRDGGYHGELK